MANSGARFTDVDLGNKRLPACFGYVAHQLVPLEEAMKKLRSLLIEIDRFIKEAKRHCTYPNDDNLTKDESAALYLYTMQMAGDASVYQILNQTLRLEDRSQLIPWFGYLKLFDTAAGKLPKFKGIVWRGVNKDLSKAFKKNQKITWWSISSCSKAVHVIKEFLGDAPKSTLFHIKCRNGRSISDFTCYPQEDEVILMPGTILQVVGEPLDHGSINIVDLKEIDDDDSSEDEESGETASAKTVKKTENKFSEITLSK